MESVYLIAGKCLIEWYESLVIASFFCLTVLASKSFQLIVDDVRSYSAAGRQATSHRVLRWKQSYASVLSFLGGVNRFYETSLVVYVVKQFSLLSFLLINAAFETYYSQSVPLFVVFDVVESGRNVILMLLLVTGCQIMKNQVK